MTLNVTFILADGARHPVTAEDGEKLMEVARTNDVRGIVAECGGSLSCATCHVYIDAAWISALPPAQTTEHELLEGVHDLRPNSRLSCQIVLRSVHDGLVVEVPERQF